MKILIAIFLIFILISCSEKDEIASWQNEILGTMECEVINEKFNATISAYAEKRNDGKTLVVSGSSEMGTISFLIDSFIVNKPIYIRQYKDSLNYTYEFIGEYNRANSRLGLSTSAKEDTGKIIIEEINSNSVTGKFYFQVSSYGSYGTRIKNGTFSLKFKK
jgi:hypothetical protein